MGSGIGGSIPVSVVVVGIGVGVAIVSVAITVVIVSLEHVITSFVFSVCPDEKKPFRLRVESNVEADDADGDCDCDSPLSDDLNEGFSSSSASSSSSSCSFSIVLPTLLVDSKVTDVVSPVRVFFCTFITVAGIVSGNGGGIPYDGIKSDIL